MDAKALLPFVVASPFFFLHQTCARPHAAAPVPSRPAGGRGYLSCAEGKPPVKNIHPPLSLTHISRYAYPQENNPSHTVRRRVASKPLDAAAPPAEPA